MAKYQDPNFNREQYWLDKQASPADKRAKRLGLRYQNIVRIHNGIEWERKRPSVKAIKHNTKRARKWLTYAS